MALPKIFNYLSSRSPVYKAQALARIQRVAFIIIGIGVVLSFAEIGIGCALVPRRCAPAISILSALMCMGNTSLLMLVFRNPSKRWPVAALAIGATVSWAGVFVGVLAMAF